MTANKWGLVNDISQDIEPRREWLEHIDTAVRGLIDNDIADMTESIDKAIELNRTACLNWSGSPPLSHVLQLFLQSLAMTRLPRSKHVLANYLSVTHLKNATSCLDLKQHLLPRTW